MDRRNLTLLRLSYTQWADVLTAQVGADLQDVTLLPLSEKVTLYVNPTNPAILCGFEMSGFLSQEPSQALLRRVLDQDILEALNEFRSRLSLAPIDAGLDVKELPALISSPPKRVERKVQIGNLSHELARLEEFESLGTHEPIRESVGYATFPSTEPVLFTRVAAPRATGGVTTDQVQLGGADVFESDLGTLSVTAQAGKLWVSGHVRLPRDQVTVTLQVRAEVAAVLDPGVSPEGLLKVTVRVDPDDGTFETVAADLHGDLKPEERMVESFRLE